MLCSSVSSHSTETYADDHTNIDIPTMYFDFQINVGGVSRFWIRYRIGKMRSSSLSGVDLP